MCACAKHGDLSPFSISMRWWRPSAASPTSVPITSRAHSSCTENWWALGFEQASTSSHTDRSLSSRSGTLWSTTSPAGSHPEQSLLRSNYETAVARVDADPQRQLSKNLELLRYTYGRVDSLLPDMPPADWNFDSTTTGWQQIVDQLERELLDT